MVSITISPATRAPAVARGLPITVEVPENASVLDVKNAIAKHFPKFYASRQKLTLKTDSKLLPDEHIVGAEKELVVKDLGPQLGWTTVFVTEYLGPLVVHPLFYFFPRLFYGQDVQHSDLQKYIYAMVMVHFVKRELETLFVHRFSKGTMPAFNIFRNSAHYHISGGLLLAFDIYRPTYGANSAYIKGTVRDSPSFLYFWIAIFIIAELSNFKTHLTLRSLRPEGSKDRKIPYGYGFNLVSCPNYLFETIAWFSVTYMTGSWAAWWFWITGTGMMVQWALKKHRSYKKQFGSQYPRGRKAMFPFIL